MKHIIRILGAALMLTSYEAIAQPGAPTPDAKFMPSITGKNSSIGNIYSPNLFDGSSNVNIPIYDFSNDHGSYGISLSYNTKGVKADEISGKAGLHWNINAGGSISRVMKNLPDEINQGHSIPPGYTGQTYTSIGRWGLYGMTTIPSNVNQDTENDDFIVSVGSLNFTFNIGKNGYVFTHPNRRVKIEKTGDINTLNFKITDEEGNQYFFAQGDYSRASIQTYATTNNSLLDYVYVSRWVISKIVFAEGSQITYEYDDKEPAKTVLYVHGESRESATTNSRTPAPGSAFVKVDAVTGNTAQLKAIYYPNGIKASFVYETVSPDPDPIIGVCFPALREIVIGTPDGSNCTRFQLNFAYHIASYKNTQDVLSPYSPTCDFNYDYGSRLILTDIKIKSCDGTLTEPYYAFEYSSSKLPSRASGSMDRFGYSNGAYPAVMLSSENDPLHLYNGVYVGKNRDVTTDVNIIAAANLTKVKNAYGGSVAFTYELHSGLQHVRGDLPVNDPHFLGKDDNDGVRIKTITETDKFHPGNARIKTFTYSGGQRFMSGGYFHYASEVTNNSGSWNRTLYKVGTYSISPHQLINGSNHGYSEVKVESRDQSGNLLGRTEYVFSNIITGPDTCLLNSGSKEYFQEPYTDRQYIKDWMVGLPIVTTNYDQDGLMVNRTTNTFNEVLDQSSASELGQQVKNMRARNGGNIDPFNDPIIATDTYLPYTGQAQLVSVYSEKFVGSQAITDIVNYGYDSRNNLKWTKTKNSRGIFSLIERTYNYDVVEGSGSGMLYDMKNNGVEKLVSTERWNLGTSGFDLPANKRLLDASITGLEYTGGKLRTKSLQTLMTGAPIAYANYTGVATTGPVSARYNKILTAYSGSDVASFQKVSEVQLFDEKSNPLETKLLNLNSYKAMLWDTATGDKLADVSNARYNEIAFTSFETGLTSGSYTGNEPVTSGRFTYQYGGLNSSGGTISGSKAYRLSPTGFGTPITVSGLTPNKTYIVSFWSKNGVPAFAGAGVTVSFEALYTAQGWTYYQGKFTPATNGTLSFTASTALFMDEVRLFPADAMMQCWTYKPLCGATSATDAAGRISYFEYDKFGRPILTRNQEGLILSKTEYHID